MSNHRYIFLIVILVSLAVSIIGLTDKNSVPKLFANTNDQPGEGLAGKVFLPIVSKPMVINTTADGTDWNPGDGYCETSPGNNTCTLRAYIQEANVRPGAATVFLPAGQYNLTIVGAAEDNGVTGDLDILDDLTIIGANSATTVIDGNQIDRVFHMIGVKSLISNVTVTNGDPNDVYGHGGGIFNDRYTTTYYGGPLTLDNVIIGSNTASNGLGGGIFSYGPLTVTNSIISHNTALGGGGIRSTETSLIHATTVHNNSGGGIYADRIILTDSVLDNNTTMSQHGGEAGGGLHIRGSATLDKCTISNNVLSDGQGGGIYIGQGASVTIRRCRILNNAALGSSSLNQGGGIYNESRETVTILDTTIQGNIAAYSGGGIFYNPTNDSTGQMNLNRVTVRQNKAPVQGAGIFNYGRMYLTNVTVSGNESVSNNNQEGGGIYHQGILLMITNSTIAENKARNGGGIYRSSGDVILENTILANNVIVNAGDPNTHNCGGFGILSSSGHNLEDGVGCNFNATGDLSGVDPLLKPLLTGYGWTAFYPLNSGSPAIDSGNNSACPPIDQRGVVRPVDGDGNGSAVCDIGAFEYP
jgi:hypothetical protein